MAEKYVKSKNLKFIKSGEYYYLYHNLFGFILHLSEDILSFIEFFNTPKTESEAIKNFKDIYGEDNIKNFIKVLNEYECIVKDDKEEEKRVWKMFPVKSRWYVYRRDENGNILFYYSDGKEAFKLPFNEWQTFFFDSITGNTQLSVLYRDIVIKFKKDKDSFKKEFEDFLKKLTSIEIQAIKLSDFPVQIYDRDPKSKPPYLSSFLPIYENIAENQDFETAKRTFYYLFRKEHEAFDGKSFGEALIHSLKELNILKTDVKRILDLSLDFGFYLKDIIKALGENVVVDVVVPDAEYKKLYEKNLGEDINKLNFIVEKNLENLKIKGGYDLVLILERIGSLRHINVNKEKPDAEFEKIVEEYNLFYNDAPEEFLFNLGALKLLENLKSSIKNDGLIVITDYGEEYQYPRQASTSGNSNLFLVHFGMLKKIAQKMGFNTSYSFIIDFLNMNRNLFIMSSNTHHFTALKKLFSDIGKDLEDIPQTPQMIKKLKGDFEIGNIFFERIEDRALSIVPHQLKMLVLSKRENEND